jgi:hypothetical protein
LFISAAYAVAAVTVRDGGVFAGALVAALAASVCIWFPDAVGSYLGYLGFNQVERQVPAEAVVIVGWVLILLPILIAPLIVAVTK